MSELVTNVPCVASPAATRLSPDEIDRVARLYLDAKAAAAVAKKHATDIEDELIALVDAHGEVPAGAEKSRRLKGRLAELTVTRSSTITVLTDRVETLRDALHANDRGDFFSRLSAPQPIKYELVKGAESALKEEALPKRLAEKVLNLFGRCFDVKPKKASLSVEIADPAKPAKKPRAKKGGE